MTNEIDKAKAVLTALEDKRLSAKAAAAEIADTIQELSFPAHTSDQAARKKLDRLESEALKAAGEIASLEDAIGEAKRRVADAVALDVDEAEKEKARTALALLDDFSKRGEALDIALTKIVREYEELTRDFRQLQSLGYEPTSLRL